ncbi:2',5'-phosphodiesterase 12 isoform X2 [Plodia interpunctella]|uniref:2',5'-phosphodiesterase 12 isoform X2 n=1 Tax=Plodia interpunctella TaxID=58824 RepID=UPI00236841ED|nr:2',5'-phosphodiesterase 12 isoform X2 [Plodia interpunctella]
MVLRFQSYVNKLHTLVSISKTKAMNLEKCYFRYVQDEERIDISFLLKVKDSVRQFNFSRKPTEQLETTLNRIGANINKVIKKGGKKKNTDIPDVEVRIFDNKNEAIGAKSTCMDLFSLQTPIKLKVDDQVYEAVFNVPWVVSVSLPACVLAGFPVQPEHLVLQHADRGRCRYHWFRGLSVNDKGNEIIENHIKWELVGESFSYTPTNDDVGKKLKLECTPGNGETYGPTVSTVSKTLVEAGPGVCPFETRHRFTSTKLKDKSFRCVSYNILADLYCDSDFTRTVLHPYCPPYALHIDYRKQLIVKELLGYNADIMCLQEVDCKIFNNCLNPVLESHGYRGLFYKKGKEVAEGLACFYDAHRFELIGEEKILISEAIKTNACLQPIWEAIKGNAALVSRLLERSTVGSASLLQARESPAEVLVVGNTHLYFHPDADHIRLLQAGALIYWLNDLRTRVMDQFPDKRVSLLVSGDFNSVPSCAVFRLYTAGAAPGWLPDWRSNAAEAVSGLSLQQSSALASACGTPPFTNYTAGFADCLDYIFIDRAALAVDQVVPLPAEAELAQHTALPSVVFPSDHLALVADLRFLP